MNVPIVSEGQNLAWVNRLELNGAVRYENYPDIGQVVTPKLGVIYTPVAGLDLKGSWGRSFKAPTLYQQYNTPVAILFQPATLGGTGYSANATVLYLSGGNPHLKPEKAETWSATVAVHPEWLKGAKLEVSYYNIDYRDRVVSPISFLTQSLSNPIYSDLVTLNPSLAAVSAAYSSAAIFANVTSAPYAPSNVVAIVNNNSTNAAEQTIHGVDVLAEYQFAVGDAGSVTLSANGAYIESHQRLSALQPEVALAGILFNPPHYRGRFGGVWRDGELTIASFLNYTGPVEDNRTSNPVRVGSMTTVDLSAQLAVKSGPAFFRGIVFSIGVENIFNAKPDQIATSVGYEAPYDSTNYSPIGRAISLSLTKKW